jgi:hypothetical protein
VRGNAPEGFHTVLDVTVRLKNGTVRSYRWTTPLALLNAMHRGIRWTKAELKEEKIKGRSQGFEGWEVRAVYAKGPYKE